MLRWMSPWPLALLSAMTAAGCSDDAQLACVEVDPACAPLYAPTWTNVYTNTIVRSCSTGGRSCHAAAGAQGGLALEGEALAHAALLAGGYVRPGDASCSELVERLYTPSASLLMPRGARLSDPEACAVARWVAAGAPGPVAVDAGVDAPRAATVGAAGGQP